MPNPMSNNEQPRKSTLEETSNTFIQFTMGNYERYGVTPVYPFSSQADKRDVTNVRNHNYQNYTVQNFFFKQVINVLNTYLD